MERDRCLQFIMGMKESGNYLSSSLATGWQLAKAQ